jgi:hypothetical protein
MQSDVHQRARFLIEDAAIAGLSKRDERWLHSHLGICGECARYSETTAKMLRGLRSLSFEVDPGMNQRVQDAIVARTGQHMAVGRNPNSRGKLFMRLWAVAPLRPVSLAAAILIVLATPTLYHTLQDRQKQVRSNADDQVLLESIAANVSRGIPEALEPLRQPRSREAPDTPRSDGARGSR